MGKRGKMANVCHSKLGHTAVLNERHNLQYISRYSYRKYGLPSSHNSAVSSARNVPELSPIAFFHSSH